MTDHQRFWRCAHHPSAIDNFFGALTTCEWGCHDEALRWYHRGNHPLPKSWGTPPKPLTLEKHT